MSRLASNLTANVLSNIWSTALSLLLLPVYVRLLGVESYGLIGFHLSWLAILGMLDTGLSATAVRELAWRSERADERHTIPTLIRTLELFYWGAILLIGVAMFAAAWWTGGHWFAASALPADTIRAALLLMVAALVVQMPSGLYVGGLNGLQRQVEASTLLALFGTLRGLGAVAVLLAVAPDIRVFFAWQVVISGLQTAAVRVALRRHVGGGPETRFSASALRAVRQFAGGTGLVTALSLVLAQGDKLILSRLVSLEAFGLYAVAWTVASGLARVALPLLQAFGPRFTELLARGDTPALLRQVRLAAQLTNALILPPAALLALLSAPILTLWLGEGAVASGAAPLLSVLAIGTVLSACSYPALSVMYSRARLKPVIGISVAAVAVLLPLCYAAILTFGVMGAALSWLVYGLLMYVAYQTVAMRGLDEAPVWPGVLRDFVAPAAAAAAVAWATWQWSLRAEGPVEMLSVIAIGLLAGWGATLLVCRDLFRVVAETWKRYSLSLRWSA